MKINQSETVVIKRSLIKFAPYNPKHHTAEAIKQQKANFQRVGFLGGIVWNAVTGNLVSGHKRVMALDIINKYDGTEATDYDIKVERIELDDKTEKEQNIYMDAKATNTQQNYNLIAEIEGIDFKLAGLDDNDINLMLAYDDISEVDSKDMLLHEISEFEQDEKQSKAEKKAKVKEAKAKYKEHLANRNDGNSYVTLSFDTYENKAQFMQMFGYCEDDLFIKGENFINKLNENS